MSDRIAMCIRLFCNLDHSAAACWKDALPVDDCMTLSCVAPSVAAVFPSCKVDGSTEGMAFRLRWCVI